MEARQLVNDAVLRDDGAAAANAARVKATKDRESIFDESEYYDHSSRALLWICGRCIFPLALMYAAAVFQRMTFWRGYVFGLIGTQRAPFRALSGVARGLLFRFGVGGQVPATCTVGFYVVGVGLMQTDSDTPRELHIGQNLWGSGQVSSCTVFDISSIVGGLLR